MQRFLFSLILAVFALMQASAQDVQPQRKLVVADMETRVPMRGVIVSTQDGYRDTTNWRGVCYVPQTFDTLTVYKPNYIPERLVQNELKDSTYLIPAGSAISEVTVWGKNDLQDGINAWIGGQSLPLPDPSTGVIGRFDLSNMLDRRGRRDRRHLRRLQQRFSEIEQSEDPIVRAYEQALAEQQAAAEAAEKKKK